MDIKKNTNVHAPSKEIIIELEEYSNVKYPTSYIEFLKRYNGAIPIDNKFVANGYEYIIERFLCIMDDPDENPVGDYDISIVLTQLDERLTDNGDLVGDELIPIAALFAGNFVCLDYRKSRTNPSICIWDHEESDIFKPITYYITESFEKFIEMLER